VLDAGRCGFRGVRTASGTPLGAVRAACDAVRVRGGVPDAAQCGGPAERADPGGKAARRQRTGLLSGRSRAGTVLRSWWKVA